MHLQARNHHRYLLSNAGFILLIFCLVFPPLQYRSSAQSHETGFQKIPIEIENVTYDCRITAISQDRDGFLWIGTSRHGLLRYDGYQFKKYDNILGDSTINHDFIITEALYVDYIGDLWIGTNFGLTRYDSVCDCFFPYTADQNTLISKGKIAGITEDSDRNLWVGVQKGGLFRYEREKDTFTRFLADPVDSNGLSNDLVRVLLADRQNNIWIGTGFGLFDNPGGLVRFDPDSGKSKRFKHESNNPNSLIDNRISALLEDQEGRIWVGTYQNGLHRYNPKNDNFERIVYDPTHPNRIYAPTGRKVWDSTPFVKILHQDQAGGFWVGVCGGGISHFDQNTNEVSHYIHDPANLNSITNNRLWSFYEDRSGQLWLGNLSQGGLHKINPSLSKVTRYSESNDLHIANIHQSKEKPDQIILGTFFKGLQELDKKTGKIKPFYHKGLEESEIVMDYVQEVYEDSNEVLWIGIGSGRFEIDRVVNEIGDGGLARLDQQTGIFNFYVIPRKDSIDGYYNTVYRICEDRKGYLWLATGKGGLFRFDKEKEVFKRYYLPGKNRLQRDGEVYLIEEDSKGTLWIGDFTEGGTLFRYDNEQDHFIPFLKGYQSRCLYEDTWGRIWMGTNNQGVLNFTVGKSQIEQIKTADGLPSNQVLSIFESPKGVYWFATDKGIIKYEDKAKKFIQTGLPHYVFTSAMLKADNGQLFLGGNSMLISFFSDQVNGNLIPPELKLRHLKISGEPYDLSKLRSGKTNQIKLLHHQNDIVFEYVALHYSEPAKNQYRYMLEPYDQDWIEAGTQRIVQYTNLDPGAYTFRVIGANDNNVWNETGITIPFIIKRAWWMRWWAYLLYLIIFSASVYGFYNFQLSRSLAVQKSERLQEITELKTKLYNNITHELRTPLTVILGMTEILKLKIQNLQLGTLVQPVKMIERNSQNLLHLVNEILDLAKIDSGNIKLNLQQADVIPFIKYVGESFHYLAAEKRIKLNIHSADHELVMDYDADKLAIIISNLLSNAIKYTPEEGEVSVHINSILLAGKTYLSIKIKDNGLGIPVKEIPYIFDRFYQGDYSSVQRSQGTGIGLALTKSLVELMKGSIQVESADGKGSEFMVQLPIHRKALRVEKPADISFPIHSINPSDNHYYEESTPGEIDLPLVLIIEDHVDVAQYIGACLQGKYQYLFASNGKLGIEMALEKIPDLIISDIKMPQKDGFEVCATLKLDERTNHIPIILLTARVTDQDRLTGLAHGADAYLAKPFKKEELWIRLDKLSELRKTLQKKYSKHLLIDTPVETSVSKEDPFIEKARMVLMAELENEDFSLEDFSEKLHLSKSQVYRKIKAVTGMSTAIFIRTIRLHMARKMLVSTNFTISEIAFKVGFKSPTYFSQSFKETFDKSPSDLRK